MLKVVTITGADNSIQPFDLLTLSNAFPFVEWAILFSRSQQGGNRFPDMGWVKDLIELKKEHNQLKLSCHLCGQYVRDILNGNQDFIVTDMAGIWWAFDRVQINTHGHRHSVTLQEMAGVMHNYPAKEFIFQYDGEHNDVLQYASTYDIKCSALFDLSHGAGLLPTEWPQLLEGVKCGYAGGISPENIEQQIKEIEAIVGENEVWIDMETHVRSDNDRKFDLDKVITCLGKSALFINNPRAIKNYIDKTDAFILGVQGDNLQPEKLPTLKHLRDYLNSLSDRQLARPAGIFKTDCWGAQISDSYVLEEDYYYSDEFLEPVSTFEEDENDPEHKLENYEIVPKGTVYLMADADYTEEMKKRMSTLLDNIEQLTSVYHELWGLAQKLPGYRDKVDTWIKGWDLIRRLKR